MTVLGWDAVGRPKGRSAYTVSPENPRQNLGLYLPKGIISPHDKGKRLCTLAYDAVHELSLGLSLLGLEDERASRPHA